MGAVLGSKPSTAMVTVSILVAEVGIFIVGDETTRNSNTTAHDHDATAESGSVL